MNNEKWWNFYLHLRDGLYFNANWEKSRKNFFLPYSFKFLVFLGCFLRRSLLVSHRLMSLWSFLHFWSRALFCWGWFDLWSHTRSLDDLTVGCLTNDISLCCRSTETSYLVTPFHLSLVGNMRRDTIFSSSFCLWRLILEEMALADFCCAEFTVCGDFYALFGSWVGFCFHEEGVKGWSWILNLRPMNLTGPSIL